MEQNGNLVRIFGGELTAEICNRIRRKRLELGLTYSQLAEFFNVHWTTMRKWEGGRVTRCHPGHRLMMQRFISGECDHLFSLPEHLQTRRTIAERQAEHQSQSCIRRLASCCRMLRERPELITCLMDEISAAVNETLRQYAAGAVSPEPARQSGRPS